MNSRTRSLPFGRPIGLASLMLMTAVVCFADDPEPGRKPFDAERVRSDLATSTSKLSDRRRKIEKVWDEILPGASELSQPSSERKQPLGYRFTRGEVFAYRFDFESWTEGSTSHHRLSGTPYGSVESVNEKGIADIFLIGKLEGSIRRADGESPDPSKTLWLGSWLRIGPQGVVSGKEDWNIKSLPPAFETLRIAPRRLLFPTIPDRLPGTLGSTSTASLFTSSSSRFGLTTLGTSQGTLVNARRADPIPGSLARLQIDQGFITNDDIKRQYVIAFRWIGRFNPARGHINDGQARLRVESTGSRPTLALLRIERLEGEAVREAHKKAKADWAGADRPPSFQPVELLRQRVSVKRPRFFKSTGDARPGLRVIHLRSASKHRDGDHAYYQAVVLKADAKPQGKVTIRYVGSLEEFAVQPATLALSPSADP